MSLHPPRLETILAQQPTRTTSLLRFFCPLCGEKALTEKDGDGVYRVSCGMCRKAAVILVSEKHLAEEAKR